MIFVINYLKYNYGLCCYIFVDENQQNIHGNGIFSMLEDLNSLSDNQITIDSNNDEYDSNQGSYLCMLYLFENFIYFKVV